MDDVTLAKAAARAAEATTVSATHEGIETVLAKSVALVPAPAATPSVKTHIPERTFASP